MYVVFCSKIGILPYYGEGKIIRFFCGDMEWWMGVKWVEWVE